MDKKKKEPSYFEKKFGKKPKDHKAHLPAEPFKEKGFKKKYEEVPNTPFQKAERKERSSAPYKTSKEFSKKEYNFKNEGFKKENPYAKKEYSKTKNFESPKDSSKEQAWKSKKNDARDFEKKEGIKKDKHYDKSSKSFEDKKPYKTPKTFTPKSALEAADTSIEIEKEQLKERTKTIALPEIMPLNKYIAYCGLCSRRDAVLLIKQGKVKVNEALIFEPGLKVNTSDTVTVSGKKIVPQKHFVYVLLNKPKGFITTTDDEKGRKTVMDLVSEAHELRLYPVGRLDRYTTGLLLLTNDGDLTQKLSHPKYNIKKVYQVGLNKKFIKSDYDKLVNGVELEDGFIKADAISILDDPKELGIEIHSGKNRIVRRIFEHLGYEVEKLDRVLYAGLTKKNLPRGTWRHLTPQEIVILKHYDLEKSRKKKS